MPANSVIVQTGTMRYSIEMDAIGDQSSAQTQVQSQLADTSKPNKPCNEILAASANANAFSLISATIPQSYGLPADRLLGNSCLPLPEASCFLVTSAMLGNSKEKGSQKKSLSEDQLTRVRERNRIHARRTRQRKKEQMHGLQSQAEMLKAEQLKLKQVINEKVTANILVGLFASGTTQGTTQIEDPRVEELLGRPIDDIPDSSKITELPSLILPGQHASKKIKLLSEDDVTIEQQVEGIDFDLLGKDRSKCSPEELDRIRRERNRMHAKRTRDRKRVFMEELAEVCRKLEDENKLLRSHLGAIDPDYVHVQVKLGNDEHELSSSSCDDFHDSAVEDSEDGSSQPQAMLCTSAPSMPYDQLRALLVAAGSFENDRSALKRRLSEAGDDPHSVSDESSRSESHCDDQEARSELWTLSTIARHVLSRAQVTGQISLLPALPKPAATVGC